MVTYHIWRQLAVKLVFKNIQCHLVVLAMAGVMALTTGCGYSGFSTFVSDSTSPKISNLAASTNIPLLFQNAHSGLCLQSASSSLQNSTGLVQGACDSSALSITENVFGSNVELRISGTNYCLDAGSSATANGSPIKIWSCDNSQEQRFTPFGSSSFRSIRSRKCFDIGSANNAQIWSCDNSDNQLFTLLSLVPPPPVATPPPTPTPAPAPNANWVYCADEHGTCTFSGTANVKYGTATAFVIKTVSGPVFCDNSIFGDPAMYYGKTCSYDPSSLVAPAPIPAPPPMPAPAPASNYVYCADEHGTCIFYGTASVKYGTATAFVIKTVSGPVFCDNSIFGDPAMYYGKTCSYDPSTLVAGAPPPPPPPSSTPTPTPTPTPNPIPPAGPQSSANFQADSTTELPNPERGFFIRLQPNEFCNGTADGYISGSNSYSVKVRMFEYEFNPATSAADVAANGSNSQISRDFACARARGVKAELLPDYCTSQFCTEGYTQAQVVAHLNALKPIFYANRDVIAYGQFGIIGAWGETYDSGSGLDYVTPRTAIQNAYLDALPPEVMIFGHMIEALVTQNPTPTSAAEAFNLSGNNTNSNWRIGYADYSFMGSSNDFYNFYGPASTISNGSNFGGNTGWSTNLNNLQLRQWAAAQSEFTPFITETDNMNDGTQRTGCGGFPGGVDSAHSGTGLDGAGQQGGILAEGPRYHLISTHRAYNEVFLNQWITDGCYDYVNNHMGYRIQYNAISHSDSVVRGGTLQVHLDLLNNGWARHLIERRVQLILSKSGASDIVCLSNVDLRLLPSQAKTPTPFDFGCQIPSGATTGSYTVKLKMPDKTPALQTMRMFTVQPANANNGGQMWDDSAGTFTTGTSVNVN